MTYFQDSTDASNLYRANSAAGGNDTDSTAVRGNLSDLMKNASVIRGTFMAPRVTHFSAPGHDINPSATYAPVW